MGSDGVFSAEMPDEPFQTIVPLDADTAERLLCARLDPDDAPPGYAEVARLLRAAAAPADQTELTGQAAAMDMFRTTHTAQPPAPRGGTRGRPARVRLVTLALAGAVAAAAVGVWTAGGAPFSRELGSPSGGPGAGGPGAGAPGPGRSGPGGPGATGSLRPTSPGLGSTPIPAPVTGGRRPVPASIHEPATARHTGDATSPGRSTHGPTHAGHPGKQHKPKPPKAKPSESESSKPEPGKD
jgi:hypothetical protein